ncbi:MAG TPA: hypothetical protein PLR32_00040 [candidate division Zixibacteria bacterium]|nr:hypothetical protein [candidate division Zixibacteria bacterium]
MRRTWSFVVAVLLLGLIAWNVVVGAPVLGDNITAAGVVVIAFTLTWWFEESGRR